MKLVMRMLAVFRILRRLNRSFSVSFLLFVLLAVFGAFMALPLIYAVNNAFKPLDELFIFPPRFLVNNPTLDNFFDLFALMGNSWVPLSRYIANTLFITIAGTAGHILLASAAAYPLAKYRFWGSRTLFLHRHFVPNVLGTCYRDSELYGHVLARLDQHARIDYRAVSRLPSRTVPHEAIHGTDSGCAAGSGQN